MNPEKCVILANPDSSRGYVVSIVDLRGAETAEDVCAEAFSGEFEIAFAVDRIVDLREVTRYIPGISALPGVTRMLVHPKHADLIPKEMPW